MLHENKFKLRFEVYMRQLIWILYFSWFWRL